MKLTLRMRITLLTGALIMIAAAGLTCASIYMAENKLHQLADDAVAITIKMQKISPQTLEKEIQTVQPALPVKKIIPVAEIQEGQPIDTTLNATLLSAAYATPAQTASREFNYISFGVMVAITLIGMLTSYYLAGKALKPVYKLNRAILDISENNLKERLPEKGKNDEISSLTSSFNTMLDRLEDSFLRQKRFSSNVAHELKTPIATMKTGLQVLELSEKPTEEEYKEVLEVAAKNITRLTSLVDDLLVLTNEGYQEETKQISLNHLFFELVEELEPLCEKNQIRFDFAGIDESFFIVGNETLTFRLFYNLIENAIKYNRPNGVIKIKAIKLLSSEESWFNITIEDTGVGIEEGKMKQIFEPFYCVNPSRSRKLGGAGLGLSIVSDIAERYGWKIKVDSNEEVGTIFQVSIPVSLDF